MKYYILECTGRKTMHYRVIGVRDSKHGAYERCLKSVWLNYMSEHDFRQMSLMELKRRDSIEMVEAIKIHLEEESKWK